VGEGNVCSTRVKGVVEEDMEMVKVVAHYYLHAVYVHLNVARFLFPFLSSIVLMHIGRVAKAFLPQIKSDTGK
jgi:hypothetical protein